MRQEIEFGIWIAKIVLTRCETPREAVKRAMRDRENNRIFQNAIEGKITLDRYNTLEEHTLRPRRILRFPNGVRLPQIRQSNSSSKTKIPNS